MDRRISKKHVGFQAYAPEDQWNDRPRVLTYVKRNLQGIQVEKRQDLLVCSPDGLVIELKSPKVSLFYMVNLYNGPRGCLRKEGAVLAICNSDLLIKKGILWMGDFNLHHED